jgi:hypothetical protein
MKALFLVPAILLVTGGTLLADITHNVPGAVCVATSGSLVNSVDGHSANITTSSASAVCPIDRDIAPTLSTKVAATVWVLDENPSADVCCQLHSKNPGGAVVTSPAAPAGPVCSTGASSTYQTLALPQLTDTSTYSHYYITCTVPGTSSGTSSMILTYRAVEE